MNTMEMIVAIGSGNVIGRAGGMPWSAPADLKRFKSITTGNALVLGRKTFETSLGGKALPNRDHFVLSTSPGWKVANDRVFECSSVDSMDARISKWRSENPDKKIFLAGGAEIYKLLADRVTDIHVSWIPGSFTGDTYLDLDSVLDMSTFKLLKQELSSDHMYQHWGIHK